MDRRILMGLLSLGVLATTGGGIALILTGDNLLMGAGTVSIIIGLVALMPLFYLAMD